MPAHLYGELCKLREGAKILEERGIVGKLFGKLSSLIEQLQLLSEDGYVDSFIDGDGGGEGCAAATFVDIDYDLLNETKSCMWALVSCINSINV